MNNLELLFSTVRTVFAELREEQSGSETPIETLSRLTREAASWRSLGKSKPEPEPVDGGRAVWPIVIDDIRSRITWQSPVFRLLAEDAQKRHEFGLAKYGKPLTVYNGRDHLRDAYQEALDLLVYLGAKHESDGTAYNLYLDAMSIASDIRLEIDRCENPQ